MTVFGYYKTGGLCVCMTLYKQAKSLWMKNSSTKEKVGEHFFVVLSSLLHYMSKCCHTYLCVFPCCNNEGSFTTNIRRTPPLLVCVNVPFGSFCMIMLLPSANWRYGIDYKFNNIIENLSLSFKITNKK